jgi:hypothetical protein
MVAGPYMRINEALEPFGVAGGRAERLVFTGENIRLPPKATLALGIALHELATNAVKYGAFSNEMGSIVIAWTIEPTPDGDRLILRWHEKHGPPVTPPSRKGFGSQVIERGLAYELEGSVHLDYQTDGVVCTINIPAPRGADGRKNAFRSGIMLVAFSGAALADFYIVQNISDKKCTIVEQKPTDTKTILVHPEGEFGVNWDGQYDALNRLILGTPTNFEQLGESIIINCKPGLAQLGPSSCGRGRDPSGDRGPTGDHGLDRDLRSSTAFGSNHCHKSVYTLLGHPLGRRPATRRQRSQRTGPAIADRASNKSLRILEPQLGLSYPRSSTEKAGSRSVARY